MSRNKDYVAVLFDLDGTLIDTAPDMIAALNVLMARANRDPIPLETARAYVSHGSRALVELGFSDLTQTKKADLIQEFLTAYEADIALGTRLFDGFAPWLKTLNSRNIAWGIVTNKPEHLTLKLLDQLKLDTQPHCIVAGDSLLKRKPHPMPTLHAAALLGVPANRCIYVGDSQSDVTAGRTSGMYTVAATYGYILPNDQPQDWHAHAQAHTVSQLVDTIDALLRD